MFEKRKSKIDQYITAEQAVWECDKNILSRNSSDNCTISIGYATHSVEDYQELVPFVLDVAESLLKDCTVFTWLKTPSIQTATSHSLWPCKKSARNNLPNLAAQYASENHPESFFDRDCEILTKTQGLNRTLMQRFFQIPHCATAFQHKLYGFYIPPAIDRKRSYKDILFSVVHPLPDFAISYENFHVELNIRFNPESVLESVVLEQIHRICKSHGKELI
ncbi:hypothetical protein [Oscillibacter sp.]|uniref:hypothetical protein n=1 Tax=Oscillibacter sp. TaxID=1945593 RepID=UPI00260CEA13|nr:hypothetical protein [Oscillibacter sp.]MDD3346680.1 hypothetical protein [Oscillibacter sp.]